MSTNSVFANPTNHRFSRSPARTVDTAASLRIWIISDDLSGPPDEGVKKYTLSLASALRLKHQVELISTHGDSTDNKARPVPASRTYVSRTLRSTLRRGKPELIIYATRRSATFFSFIRARFLRSYCPGVPIVLMGLQTRRHTRWQQLLIRHLKPDMVIVQSNTNREYLARLGCKAALIPSGVDIDTFHPVSSERRLALRHQYGLDAHTPIVLHVGHLQEGRGIRDLIPLAKSGRCQVLLVTSTSTRREARLAAELEATGIKLLTEYLPRIEEVYQLADCYVFPVKTTDNSIEIPLSVLEALSCDLPVVTTRFGGLERLFGDINHPGIVWIDTPEEMTDQALRVSQCNQSGTRVFALPFSWDYVAQNLLSAALPTVSVT